MTRIAAETIVLGGEDYLLRPLSIAQVQAIEPLLSDMALQSLPLRMAATIVIIGLGRDYKDRTLDDLDASATELPVAMNTVLRLGGFIAQSETTPGESGAAARNASTGAPLKPASQRRSEKPQRK